MNWSKLYGIDKSFVEHLAGVEAALESVGLSEHVLAVAREQANLTKTLSLISGDLIQRAQTEHRFIEEMRLQDGVLDEHFRNLGRTVALDNIVRGLSQQCAHVDDAIRSIWDSSALVNQIQVWNERVAPWLEIDWEAVRKRVARSFRFASDHGWFLPGEPDDVELPIEDCGDDVEMLDELFESYVAECAESIEHRLTRDFEARAQHIAEAFQLFREKRYTAAIPLLLLSADGIALEVTGKSAFGTAKDGKSRVPNLAPWVEQQLQRLELQPFIVQLGSHHALARTTTFTGSRFSRHCVLHGRDVAFGTRRNALQAIAYLGQLGWFVMEVRRASESTPDGAASAGPRRREIRRGGRDV